MDVLMIFEGLQEIADVGGVVPLRARDIAGRGSPARS